ncbi:response regulator transcription factor [Paludibacterium paludis]|uniref:DNA-binding response regulator n=1 Tax=Paludibacterium paludis TaxID=1225769 RepID=A0A918UA30_9NEIS|nr:response regulator transcription factor [Paludibacterium paludis]GGY19096.1 DNA-binding response regulator [Paludibacterium paludis]
MKRLVVIDAHPAIRVAVRAYLEEHGDLMVVDEAGNAVEGIETVRKQRPDLVILDPNLSGGDGLGLIRRLKLSCEGVRILILAGQEEAVYLRKAMEEGVDGFVGKSRDMSVVLNTVNAVLSGYRCFPGGGGDQTSLRTVDERLMTLSMRELTVLQHIARGYSNKQIATLLFISEKTVSTHKARVLTKLNLKTVIDLAQYARDRNLV